MAEIIPPVDDVSVGAYTLRDARNATREQGKAAAKLRGDELDNTHPQEAACISEVHDPITEQAMIARGEQVYQDWLARKDDRMPEEAISASFLPLSYVLLSGETVVGGFQWYAIEELPPLAMRRRLRARPWPGFDKGEFPTLDDGISMYFDILEELLDLDLTPMPNALRVVESENDHFVDPVRNSIGDQMVLAYDIELALRTAPSVGTLELVLDILNETPSLPGRRLQRLSRS